MNFAAKILLVILALLLLVLGGAIVYFFRFAHLRRSQVPDDLERDGPLWQGYKKMMDEGYAWLKAQRTEQVTITSFDGLKLRGTYIPVENARAGAFLFHGYLSRYGLEDWARDRYNAMGVKASACVECGDCESRCPYDLPIREMLKKVAADFGA